MLPAFFSSSPPSDPRAATAPPFVLEMRSLDLQPDGTFTPEAAVLLTPALLESDLLTHLSPIELQTLLLVMGSVTSNGSFVATVDSLATRLRLWPGQMRARLERLVGRQWQGQPLLRCHSTASGLRFFSPSQALFEVRRSLVFPAPDQPGAPLERPAVLQQGGPRIIGGLRDRVVEHSRAAYGRPRAEVEAEIERFLGSHRNPATSWPGSMEMEQSAEKPAAVEAEPSTPEDIAKRALGRRLMETGLGAEQARFLVESFPAELIERQLEYLPYRHARNPAGMLVASIEGDYAPPLSARTRAPAIIPGAESGSQGEGMRGWPTPEEGARQTPSKPPVPLANDEGEERVTPLSPDESDA